MAVPTLISITPDEGHTGGDTLVEIIGTGFQLPPPPPPYGMTTAPPPTVQVLFGAEPATDIGVTEDWQIFCRSPINDPGSVSITVQNIDPSGAVIAGESVTGLAYLFSRPDFTKKGELARVLGLFMLDLRRQLTDNVDWAVHTDFDATLGDLNIAYQGKLPALVLADLELPEREPQLSAETYTVQLDASTFIERRAPVVVDAVFALTGMSDNPIELFNLLEATKIYFQKNISLKVWRDPIDRTHGVVEYAVRASIGSSTKVTRQTDNSNMTSFSGTVFIENIRLEDMPGMTTKAVPGVPAWMPHEGTLRYGWTAETIVIQKCPA